MVPTTFADAYDIIYLIDGDHLPPLCEKTVALLESELEKEEQKRVLIVTAAKKIKDDIAFRKAAVRNRHPNWVVECYIAPQDKDGADVFLAMVAAILCADDIVRQRNPEVRIIADDRYFRIVKEIIGAIGFQVSLKQWEGKKVKAKGNLVYEGVMSMLKKTVMSENGPFSGPWK